MQLPFKHAASGTGENSRAREEGTTAILKEMSPLFPDIGLLRDDVLDSWAGARPRTALHGQLLGSMETMEHDLTGQGKPNFFVFTGGLLMTHRDAGRRLTAAVARRLEPSAAPQEIDYSARLVPDGAKVNEISVSHVVEQEQARTLAGVLRRRLPVAWGEDFGLGHVEEAACIARPLLGWSAAHQAAEIDRFRKSPILNFGPRDAAKAMA